MLASLSFVKTGIMYHRKQSPFSRKEWESPYCCLREWVLSVLSPFFICEQFINIADPRITVTARSEHFARTFCDSLHLFRSLFYSPQKNFLIFSLSFPPICTAAAAESLQSCQTLCDPIDGSPPGSSIHGIFHARILEWVAIAFSSFILHLP